jgi:hypothetical protein
MKPLVWVHADSMSRFTPPFRKYPDAPAVFVLDPEQMQADISTVYRTAFLCESALELMCEIRGGDTTSEVLWAARARGCDTVVTVDSPDPEIRRVCKELRKSIHVEVLPASESAGSKEIDLRSFTGYWKSATPQLI